MLKGLITAALAACLILPLAQRASADEAAANAALAQMLDDGWGTNAAFRTAGNKQRDAAFAAAGYSPQALYAVAVMYIKQGRYAEAQKLIDEHLSRDDASLVGQRARVWLSAILKNYSGAMISAEQLATSLPAASPEDKDADEAQRECIAFLGRIYGFLGGPAAGNVKLDERKTSERKVLATLSTERRALFEEARDGVLQKHLELIDEKDATADAAKEAAEDAKAKTLDEIAKEREERAARLKELQGRSDKLKGELRDELAQIAKEDRPLVNELAGLERRAASINRELFSVQSQISSVQAILDREENPNRRGFLLAELDRLLVFGSRLDGDLAALNRLAAGVQSQRAALAARQQKAQQDIGGQIKRINDEGNDLTKREKRAAAIEKRTERSTPSTPASALALRATASALATYDPFPLEQEKARILKSLK
jgi:hypothetical protein